ncbi:protein of unknown function [Gracilibacillus ureilyticus]|uniref:Prolow-density lipoprotein receptor-related protein 1-like beta-propeller domain-containing protein n=1 Tax=Gracilibacillus ureilyticus TaxID=531814 RepID=A0A1H9MN23_9BACI|nr:DUF5050 domain-containing protein [Gracilibacillus ureilyticus]SER24553.1 protein of unknown function [Gracilibacillus ureilyticus]
MRIKLLLLLSVMVILSACSANESDAKVENEAGKHTEIKEPDEKEKQEPVEEKISFTNSSGNINAGGDYLMLDDWIYFSYILSDGHLFKMKTDGTEAVQLTDYPVSNLQIAGSFIYYIKVDNSSGYPLHESLHKMRLDGTGEKVIINQPIGNLYASGDDLLFIMDGSVYKWNTADEEQTKLPYAALSMSVSDTRIVYYDHDGYHLGNTEGTEDRFLFLENYGEYILDGEDLFYTIFEGDSGLFHYSLPNDTQANLISKKIDYFNVDRNNIYYSSAEAEVDRTIYELDRMSLEENNLHTAVSEIHVFDELLIGAYSRQGVGAIVLVSRETKEAVEMVPVK